MRGATPEMISLFQLSFSYDSGIQAVADEALTREYAPPGWEDGNAWILNLGREIRLEANDVDGQIWMDSFVEEVLDGGSGYSDHWMTTPTSVDDDNGDHCVFWVTSTTVSGARYRSQAHSDHGACSCHPDALEVCFDQVLELCPQHHIARRATAGSHTLIFGVRDVT